jgi:hypothetical protein
MNLGFLAGSALVSEIGKWKDPGDARDDDGAIFAMLNSPLSKGAGEQQTI